MTIGIAIPRSGPWCVVAAASMLAAMPSSAAAADAVAKTPTLVAEGAAGERLGTAVAIEPEAGFFVAGAPGAGGGAGALLVFERSFEQGTPIWRPASGGDVVGGRLTAPGPLATDELGGFGLDMTNERIAAGTGRFAVEMYRFDGGGVWVHDETVPLVSCEPPADASCAGGEQTVAIDGRTLAVGLPDFAGGTGVVELHGEFVETGRFEFLMSLIGPTALRFGAALDIGDEVLAVGAPGSPGDRGRVYMYEREGLGAVPTAVIEAPGTGENFGTAVSLSADGSFLAVSAPAQNIGMNEDGALYLYRRFAADTWELIASVAYPLPASGGEFGVSIELLDSERVIVGAPAPGNGVPARAFLVTRSDSGMYRTEQIAGVGVGPLDELGRSVGWANELFVLGAPQRGGGAGAVYGGVVGFERRCSLPAQPAQSLNTFSGTGLFGTAVATDGLRIIVGDPGAPNMDINPAGRAYIYELSTTGSSYLPIRELERDGDVPGGFFGDAVDISGDVAVVGAPFLNNGETLIIRRGLVVPGVWDVEETLFEPDPTTNSGEEFGASVSLTENFLYVGAPNATIAPVAEKTGSVSIYEDAGSGYALRARVTSVPDSRFGAAVDAVGQTFLVGSPLDEVAQERRGSARLYGWVNLTTPLVATITSFTAPDGALGDEFGAAVAYAEGIAVIGAPEHDAAGDDYGAVYVFERTAASDWVQTAKLLPGAGLPDQGAALNFGASVAVSADGDRIVVGAPGADVSGADSGRTYVFELIDGVWTSVDRISGVEAGESIGASVALSGDTVIAGAPEFDFGVDPRSGRVRVYDVEPCRRVAFSLPASVISFSEGTFWEDAEQPRVWETAVVDARVFDTPGVLLTDPVILEIEDVVQLIDGLEITGSDTTLELNGNILLIGLNGSSDRGVAIAGDPAFRPGALRLESSAGAPAWAQVLGDIVVGGSPGTEASLTIDEPNGVTFIGESLTMFGGTAEVLVRGSSCLLEIATEARIGSAGDARLRVLNGGTVITESLGRAGQTMLLAAGVGSTARLTVAGAGSRLTHEGGADSAIRSGDGAATVEVADGGVLQALAIELSGGDVLRGDGRLEADLFMTGTIRPSSGTDFGVPGVLTISGDAALSAPTGGPGAGSGTLEIVVDTAVNPPVASELAVSGVADLSGSLVLDFTDGPPATPTALNGLVIATAASFDGLPTAIVAPGIGGGFTVDVAVNPAGARAASLVLSIVPTASGDIDLMDPTFGDVGPGFPTDVAFGDVTGEGFDDAAVAIADPMAPFTAPGRVEVLLSSVSGGMFTGFSPPQVLTTAVGVNPSAITIGDVDNNGLRDIVVANRGDPTDPADDSITIIFNNPFVSGFLDFVQIPPPIVLAVPDGPVDVEILDADGNGLPDVAVACAGVDDKIVILFDVAFGQPRSTGSEEIDLPDDAEPTSVLPGDVNADGITDIAFSLGGSNTAGIAPGQPAGVFAPATQFAVGTRPEEVTLVDVNGDMLLDVLTVNSVSSTISLLVNQSAGGVLSLASEASIPLGDDPRNPTSIAFGDLDDDGDQDLAVVADEDPGSTRTTPTRVVQAIRNDTGASTPVFVLDDQQVVDPDPQIGPQRVRAGDVDGDGLSDLGTLNLQDNAAVPTPTDQVGVLITEVIVCVGDGDGDGDVDLDDFSVLAINFGSTTVPPGMNGDHDDDGDVDLDDFSLLAVNFGCGV